MLYLNDRLIPIILTIFVFGIWKDLPITPWFYSCNVIMTICLISYVPISLKIRDRIWDTSLTHRKTGSFETYIKHKTTYTLGTLINFSVILICTDIIIINYQKGFYLGMILAFILNIIIIVKGGECQWRKNITYSCIRS